MALVSVDDSSLHSDSRQVGWLGLRVISHLALFVIHSIINIDSGISMNMENSGNSQGILCNLLENF